MSASALRFAHMFIDTYTHI